MLQNQYIMFHLRKQNINRNEIHDLDFPIKIYIYIHELHYDDDHMMCGDDVKGVGQKGKRRRSLLWAPTILKTGTLFLCYNY
jgi:hypothetical protein